MCTAGSSLLLGPDDERRFSSTPPASVPVHAARWRPRLQPSTRCGWSAPFDRPALIGRDLTIWRSSPAG